MTPTPNRRRAECAGLALLALAAAARADDDHRPPAAPRLAAYAQECGSCHVAYSPGLLPAASWQRLMTGLPRHFGADASLEPASAQAIGGWLAQHAGTDRRLRREPSAPPEDRISRSAWFQREHREVTASTWALPAVGSAANCGACHTQAEQGDFSERHLRLPR
jgi:hypothetical protein